MLEGSGGVDRSCGQLRIREHERNLAHAFAARFFEPFSQFSAKDSVTCNALFEVNEIRASEFADPGGFLFPEFFDKGFGANGF